MPPDARPDTTCCMKSVKAAATISTRGSSVESTRRPASSALVPVSATRPTSRTYARCDALSAIRASCSTTSTVSPSSSFSCRTIRKNSRTIIGARPSEGSSRSSSRGRLISARPSASICCSPPESVPARWPPRSVIHGKYSAIALDVGLHRAVAARVRAEPEVLRHGEVDERAAPLGHVRDPGLRGRLRPTLELLPVELDRARCARRFPRSHAASSSSLRRSRRARRRPRPRGRRARRRAAPAPARSARRPDRARAASSRLVLVGGRCRARAPSAVALLVVVRAEVRLDHGRVGLHLRRRAVRDLAARSSGRSRRRRCS